MKRSTVRFFTKKAKLAYLWIDRILLAPNHMGASLLTRLKASAKGFTPDQYILYDFDNVDSNEYLSEFDWYRSRYINDPFDDLFNNKVICSEVLKHYANVPQTLLVKQYGWMEAFGDWDEDVDAQAPDTFATVDDALAIVRKAGSVFMKPISRGKGDDVHKIDFEHAANPQPSGADAAVAGAYAIDGESASEQDVADLLGKTDGYFLCKTVAQHRFLNELFADATHTMRTITVRDPETGEFQVMFAVLRIGTASTVPVDNGSRGGLVACIDLETGELSEARSIQALGSYDVHPDSGTPIKGARIPDWANVKEQVLALARRIPFAHFIAWDILLVDDGICVIEANTSSGVNIIQLWGPQRQGELGDFYRAHNVIS